MATLTVTIRVAREEPPTDDEVGRVLAIMRSAVEIVFGPGTSTEIDPPEGGRE